MNRRTLLTTGVGLAATAACTAGCDSHPDSAAPGAPGTGERPGGTPSGTAGRTARPPKQADWEGLAKGLAGGLVRPDDADYAVARQLYNTRFDGLRPAAVAYPEHTSDVAECLSFARRHGTGVAIRNGGHSYAGYSSGDDRLVIDVSVFQTVRTSSATEAHVGGGAKLIDVYTDLAAHGVTVPAGSCPTVGISGLALGGGHGVVSRAYGLTADSITGATVVTADGRTRQCSADSEPDLFWALRGAGCGNFGVVTELRLRTHAAADGVSGQLSWPWSQATAVLRAWQEWGPDQPDEIWSAAHLTAEPGGTPTLSVSVFSLGGYRDLQNAVDRLADRAGGSAASVSLRRHSYLDAMRMYGGCANTATAQCRLPGPRPGRATTGTLERETYGARSHFFDRSLDDAGLHTLVRQVERYRDGAAGQGSATVALTALGGAVNRPKPLDTSFVHRRSRMLAQFTASWPASGTGKAQFGWLDQAHEAMRSHASGAAYQNYTDSRLKDWRTAYYGAAADRLTSVKRKYDPKRLFDFPQAL